MNPSGFSANDESVRSGVLIKGRNDELELGS